MLRHTSLVEARGDDLLTVNGVKKSPGEVYRKVRAVELAVLTGADNVSKIELVPDEISLAAAAC